MLLSWFKLEIQFRVTATTIELNVIWKGNIKLYTWLQVHHNSSWIITFTAIVIILVLDSRYINIRKFQSEKQFQIIRFWQFTNFRMCSTIDRSNSEHKYKQIEFSWFCHHNQAQSRKVFIDCTNRFSKAIYTTFLLLHIQ